MTDTAASQRPVALWLLTCCALIFAMVVVGGVTRLTRSGLSIVEWAPIMGAIPPLNATQWEETFDRYKATPEYRKVNVGMDLEEFKDIFWMEYSHRLLGRAIGIVFIVPFLYFWLRGRLHRNLIPRLAAMFVLGGLQGALGWYMVKSGLVEDPHVSPYRLTAHLSLAFLIYAFMLWTALSLLFPNQREASASTALRRFGLVVTGLIFVMVLSGGFVAGTKAGFAFNTFPTMNGHWIPPGILGLDPLWRNFFENIATVQFDHRVLAMVLVTTILAFWLKARTADLARETRWIVHALVAVLALQVGLGITTLVHHVPIALAAAHQAGALLLFSVALWLNHRLRSST